MSVSEYDHLGDACPYLNRLKTRSNLVSFRNLTTMVTVIATLDLSFTG